MAPIEEELQKVFKEANEDVPFGDNGGLLLKECVNICKTHNLKAEDLYAKWAAASYNAHNRHSIISRFTISTLAEVKRKLERDLDSAVKASGRVGRGAATGAMRAPRAFPARMAANATALANRASSAVGQGSGSGMARDMDLDGVPQVKVKVEEDGSVVAIGSDSVTFKGPQMDEESKKKRRYRYMYEKITERSEALDDRIDEFGELVREHYKIPELGDPTSSTDEEIVVVGRITHDYDSASPTSKLTEATLTLESSRILSAGALIPLAFANPVHVRGGPRGVAGMGFFPGTIVALKGKSGVKFMASEILAIPPLKPSPAAAGAASELKIDSDPESPSFSAWVASGPFTQDSDLEYRPWQSLLTALKAGKPNVLILVGPFVDSAHPKFQSGDVESTPTGIFTTKFYQPLRAYLNTNPRGIAILVPSVRDLISDHAVFPQSEFTYLPPRQPRHDSRIHFVPNPASFSINGITFGATSVDVLFHLRKEEFFKRCGELNSSPLASDDLGTDPMANICRHLLQQRSFYPIFPPPLDLAHEVNLDVSHWEGLRLDQGHDGYAPDILILPSRLKQFSKAVHYTTAINPSSLNKGAYATIQVGEGAPGKTLRERMKVEIVGLESS